MNASSASRRVAITGMGIWSCIGNSISEVSEALYQGRSGIGVDPERLKLGFTSPLTGLVATPEIKDILPRRARQNISEHGTYALMATEEALAMANLSKADLQSPAVGLLYGNDSSSLATYQGLQTLLQKGRTTLMGSGNIFQTMNSTVTMNLNTIYGMRGINLTVSAACASGSHSVGLAYLLIRAGMQECIICGGAKEVNPYGVANFDALNAFSTRTENPQGASRPFDRGRDGLVPSGGAATLILEDMERAKARGARIIAEVIGYGFSSNGDHISVPNVEGPAYALKQALDCARVAPNEVEYVNAHATSTPIGDRNEALALLQVFGENGPYVSSTKSQTGHEMWMAGASELIYSLLMLQGNFMTGTLNFNAPEEEYAALNLSAERQDRPFNLFVSNSFGFGGTNSAVVVRQYQE